MKYGTVSGSGEPGAEQGFQRDGVPADGLPVHECAVVRGTLDDAGDAEEPLGREAGGAQHLGDAVTDVADDDLDLVALRRQRVLGAGEFG